MTGELELRLARSRPFTSPDLAALRAALVRRAEAEGLLDVAYAAVDSPIGELTVFVTPRGVVRLSFDADPIEAQLEEVAERVSPRIFDAPQRTDALRRELDAYFARRLTRFETRVDWGLVRGFTSSVLHATAQVPYGHVATYGEVATAAGSPQAYRAAGNALHVNPIPIVVPCHRVVPAGGRLGGYGGGPERKAFLLDLEGARPAA